jgi:hypothetical protein
MWRCDTGEMVLSVLKERHRDTSQKKQVLQSMLTVLKNRCILCTYGLEVYFMSSQIKCSILHLCTSFFPSFIHTNIHTFIHLFVQ